jgi:hypothetical protein
MQRKWNRKCSLMFCGIFVLLIGLVIFSYLRANSPDLSSYSRSPNDLLIYIDENTTAGGPIIGEMCNHIPNLRIWGDGRLVYVQHDNQTGGRVVYTGYLDSDQVAAALDLLYNHGFFVPVKPEPANPSGTFFFVKVYLAAGQQNPTVRSERSFLSDLVNSFDLSQFTRFAPSEALLVTNIPFASSLPSMNEWPARFGISLADADQGLWIQGEALETLWQFVNEWQGAVPMLRENGTPYSIALEIPGISILDPPYDCWYSNKIFAPTKTPVP